MTDDAPGISGKLPGRPLTISEGRALEVQESERSWVRPESIIIRDDDQVVVALMAINRESGNAWLLGFSPDDGGWSVVDQWTYDDIEHDKFYARLDEWEQETFADREEWTLG